MSTLNSFTLFPYLPVELRLEIWRFSCEPRVVEIEYDPEADECYSPTKPPVVLYVCREARRQALRFYAQMFRTRTWPAAIYFCPEIDILYLPRRGVMGYDDTCRDFEKYVFDTVEHILSLAIDHVRPDIRRPWETYNKFSLMQSFPHLQQAFLILTPERAREDDEDDDEQHRAHDLKLVDPNVDPTIDPSSVLEMMDAVLESFCYEVGPAALGLQDNTEAPYGQTNPPLVPKLKMF